MRYEVGRNRGGTKDPMLSERAADGGEREPRALFPKRRYGRRGQRDRGNWGTAGWRWCPDLIAGGNGWIIRSLYGMTVLGLLLSFSRPSSTPTLIYLPKSLHPVPVSTVPTIRHRLFS